MDILEIKQQVLAEVVESLNMTLREVEPQVIERISNIVKEQYEQTLNSQKSEILVLQKRVQELEETVAWIAHKTNMKI